MSAQNPNPEAGPRERLLNAALRLLASGGPEALQARRLAAEIGASTMAVYTHFGGMRELVDAMVRDGFARLEERLGQVPKTDDPVADLFRIGLAYRVYALDNPQLYRVMFGLSTPGGYLPFRQDVTVDGAPTTLAEGQAAFDRLVGGFTRVLAAGRIRPIEPAHAAAQFWSAGHGSVLLEIAGYFGEDPGLEKVLGPLAVNLVMGLGDSFEAATRSAQRVMADFVPGSGAVKPT